MGGSVELSGRNAAAKRRPHHHCAGRRAPQGAPKGCAHPSRRLRRREAIWAFAGGTQRPEAAQQSPDVRQGLKPAGARQKDSTRSAKARPEGAARIQRVRVCSVRHPAQIPVVDVAARATLFVCLVRPSSNSHPFHAGGHLFSLFRSMRRVRKSKARRVGFSGILHLRNR